MWYLWSRNNLLAKASVMAEKVTPNTPTPQFSGYQNTMLCTAGNQQSSTAENQQSSTAENHQLDEWAVGTSTASTANYASSSFKARIVAATTKLHHAGNTKNLPDSNNRLSEYDVQPVITPKNVVATEQSIKGHSGAVETTKTKGNTNKVGVGYAKDTYAVLIGDKVKQYATNLYAKLPLCDKAIVKERLKVNGIERVKLKLSQNSAASVTTKDKDIEGIERDETKYFRENNGRTGYIIFTSKNIFRGDTKYPLPTGKATDTKIGKGGNGFVFSMYHENEQFAVKKTVYRSNEVQIHSALNHPNILKLFAVLIGNKHERHRGKFYCFHFMPQMDCDFRQILSSKGVGCLTNFYRICTKDLPKFEVGFTNIKYILHETLEALKYMHSHGYVHRDVKASNIMLKMKCRCTPLECRCSTKFEVKLGDFDSAGTVPGLGITEPTDQTIKFASILPLGTPGYRAPEVSMHITLSGPYETLYTTAIDIWSFGCLALNISIGKTAALKQREEACMLLSKNKHVCGTEGKTIWRKTAKITELESAKPFKNDPFFISLINQCLNTTPENRPSAASAIELLNQSQENYVLPNPEPIKQKNFRAQSKVPEKSTMKRL